MQYKNFKDIRLSALGMGNMRLPTGEDGKIDYDRAREIIDLAMKEGINYYDTAYVYHGGESEKFLGKELVGRYPRDSFYLASKFLIFVTDDYKAVFEEQLKRLDTDYRAHLKTPFKQEHKRHGTKKAIFIPKRSKYRLK